MRFKPAAAAMTMLIILAAVPIYAHHAFAAEYDHAKPNNMTGKFVSMDWTNPHSWVHFEVTHPKGEKQMWKAETPPPNRLLKSALQAGDEVQMVGFAARDGSTKMWSSSV